MSALWLYGVLTDILSPLVRRHLRRRAKEGKEDLSRLSERFGFASAARPPHQLIWAHAASVGESLSLLPLLEAISERLPCANVLVTSGTVTSAKLLAERLPTGIRHQFVPVDLRHAVRRFLDHWKPQLAILVESELWPNLIVESHRRHIPIILLNGRISERSFAGWLRFHRVIRKLFSDISLVLAQDERHAARWRVLGAAHVDCTGDLKAAPAALPADPKTLAALSAKIGRRPVWLAASTHPGEEAVVFDSHRHLAATIPGLLTLIAPRHPKRGDDIMREAAAAGIRIGRRSASDRITDDTDVYLVDTLGEMGVFYDLAAIVLIAGSLGTPGSIGGHNPLEAARFGRAILHGPDMANCQQIAQKLDESGGAILVQDGNSLTSVLERLLRNPQEAAAMGQKAFQTAISEGNGVIAATMQALEPFLRQVETASSDSDAVRQ